MPTRATAAFLAGLSAEARAAFEGVRDLDARTAKWGTEAFLGFLAARVKAEDAPGLEGLAVADLQLAFSALSQDAAAHEALDRQVRTLLARESRNKESASELDEVRQIVARIVLVEEGKRKAALEGYTGRGPLGGWLRVIVLRELLRVRKAKQKGAVESDDALADRVSPDDDPELKFLKQRYRSEFRAAFSAALQTLTERDRNLLRHHFIDGLTIDDLGERFAVHRATVARWLAKAKQDAASATRSELKRRLKLSSKDLDSLVRLVITRLELSLGSLRG